MEKTENNKNNNIEDVVDTTPLPDVRRTRTRSTGRPPSQVFRKENALLRCISLECDDLSTEVEEDHTMVKETTTEEINLILNGVTEVTPQKKKADEETIVDGKINLIRRTSLATPALQPKRVIKEEIPWMNEFRKKRDHKRSLVEEEKKSVEEVVKSDEINRMSRATTFESRKITIYPKSEPDKNVTKNEDETKSERSVDINKKSEDIKTIEENLIGRSKVVANETNFTKHTSTSSFTEMHQFTTTTTESTSSKQNTAQKINIESHAKKSIELPNVNLKETDSNKIETSSTEIILASSPKADYQISAPKLPTVIQKRPAPKLPMAIPNPTNEIDNKIEEKQSSKIQNQELITKIKNFEETCNKQLKNIRNEVKILHRELASLSEFVSEFVKTVQHDIESTNNEN